METVVEYKLVLRKEMKIYTTETLDINISRIFNDNLESRDQELISILCRVCILLNQSILKLKSVHNEYKDEAVKINDTTDKSSDFKEVSFTL